MDPASLAKRLQLWRSMIEFDAGHIASADIAPAFRTHSFLSNEDFEAAYGGLAFFKPLEVFDKETAADVMALLLLSNVSWGGSLVFDFSTTTLCFYFSSC